MAAITQQRSFGAFTGKRYGTFAYKGGEVVIPESSTDLAVQSLLGGIEISPYLDGDVSVLPYIAGKVFATPYISGFILSGLGESIMTAPVEIPWLVFGSTNEDDVRARIAAMPVFEYDPTAKVITVPAGDWRVDSTITIAGQVLQGAGRDVSRLWVDREMVAVDLYADSAGRRNMRAWDDGRSELGSSVRHLSILGTKQGVGIRFDGDRVCDNFLIVDVACRTLRYGYHMVGAAIRECNFLHCIASNNIVGWMIEDAQNPATTEGTNNVRWSMCDSMYNQDHAVHAINNSTTAIMRVFQWQGGIIHGLVPSTVDYPPSLDPKPLIVLDGTFWGANFNAHFIGPGGASLMDIRNNTITHTGLRLSGTWVRQGTVAVATSDPATTVRIDLAEWGVGDITS